jgi:hypothetical protein
VAIIIDYTRKVHERQLAMALEQLAAVSESRREHEDHAMFHVEQALNLEHDESMLQAQVKRLEAKLLGGGDSVEPSDS